MIGWSYLNTRTAALAALRDYPAMQNILAAAPQALITAAAEQNPSSAGQSAQQLRCRQALSYMDWFAPAWEYLSPTEQLVLKEFYQRDSLRSGASARLQIKLGYSERNVDKIRSRALSKLAKQLYGG